MARIPITLLLFCVLFKLATLGLAGSQYGYLSDELYFLDVADHLAFGYVDLPPGLAWLIALLRPLMGDSVWALRLVATLIGTAVVVLAVAICRQLGGAGFAQWLTAIVLLTAPAFVSVQAILTMNVLDQLWWALSMYLLLRYLRGGAAANLLYLGLVFGLGILTKLSILALGLGLAIAFLVWDRSVFGRRETWLALLITVLVALPYGIWQIVNDWPFLEFVRAYNTATPEAMVINSPLFGLFVTLHPPYAPIWLPGLVFAVIARDRALRILGTAAVLCLALFLYAGVKFYFATPLFVLFVAAGALLWERWAWLARRRLLRTLVLAGLLLSGLSAIPIGAPVLPPHVLQTLADWIRDGEQGIMGEQPARIERYFPHFAEMHGWPELVALTADIYESLSDRERAGAVLVAAYYGQAGALNQLDRSARLPPAYSGHMSYHLWNEGTDLGKGLYIGFDEAQLRALFDVVIEKGVLHCARCMGRENGLKIYYVDGPLVPAAEIRQRIKRYYFF